MTQFYLSLLDNFVVMLQSNEQSTNIDTAITNFMATSYSMMIAPLGLMLFVFDVVDDFDVGSFP